MDHPRLLLLSVALLLCTFGISESSILSARLLRMINDFPNNTVVTVHCLSGDDDLRTHYLAYKKNFTFKFRVNIIGSTLFYCNFRWGDRSEWFDIFDNKKTSTGDCRTCVWSLRPTGPCRLLALEEDYWCFPWNAKPKGVHDSTRHALPPTTIA